MSRESLRHIDNRIVFRETFNSEFQTRRQTSDIGSAITWSNGKAVCDGSVNSFIDYPINLKDTYSIRIKLNVLNLTFSQYLIDCRQGSGLVNYIYIAATTGIITSSSGTKYVNGVLGSTITALENNEIVVTGISLSASILTLFARYDHIINQGLNGECDLIEIYKGTLTASEVKNLYNNRTYHELPDKIDENTYKILDVATFGGVLENKFSGNYVDGSTLQSSDLVNLNYDTFIVNGSTGFTATSTGGSSRFCGTADELLIKLGKNYLVEFDLVLNSGTAPSISFNSALGGTSLSNSAETIEGKNNHILIATATPSAGVLQFLENQATNYTISNLSIKEIVPELVNTDVEIKKIGSNVYSPEFNGSTSKIDCGNFDDLIEDITHVCWVNARSIGEVTGKIIDNGKLILRYSTLNRLVLNSNGSTTTISASNAVPYNEDTFVAITRTASGVTNFYIGDKDTAPVLNGTANQAGGTPLAGTTNIILGNNNAGSNTWDGKIFQTVIYKGLLSLEQITQEWSNSRRYYG